MEFKWQILLCGIFIVAGFGLSLYAVKDIFYNLAWAFTGFLFAINPVYPQTMGWLDAGRAKRGIQAAGVILIFIGITNGFGV